MNNNAMMMLLPFLFSQRKGGSGGLPSELLMGLMNNGQVGGNANPMMKMLLSMMTANVGNTERKPREKTVDVAGIFGKDVQAMLRVFTTMNEKGIRE